MGVAPTIAPLPEVQPLPTLTTEIIQVPKPDLSCIAVTPLRPFTINRVRIPQQHEITLGMDTVRDANTMISVHHAGNWWHMIDLPVPLFIQSVSGYEIVISSIIAGGLPFRLSIRPTDANESRRILSLLYSNGYRHEINSPN